MARSIGERIQELRKKRNLTQAELAEKLDISPQAVSKWENDLAYPDITVLKQLSDILETSVDQILTDEVPPETSFLPESKRKNYEDLVFKIRIRDKKDKVNVNLPLPLLDIFKDNKDAFLQINDNTGTTQILNSIDFNKLIELAEKGILGKLIEIEGEDGETVEIFVE